MSGLFRLLLLLFCVCFASTAYADKIGLLVSEVDGNPADTYVYKIILPNGTASIIDGVLTYTDLGGGSSGVNEVYGSGWNADTNAPEKDDVYDYLHLLDTDDDGDIDTIDATVWATKQAADADLTTWAGITPSANLQTFLTTPNAANFETAIGSGAFASDLLGYANAAAVLSGIGAQAADVDLTTYAGITPSVDVQTLLGYANFAAIKAGLSIDDLITLSGVADGAVNLGTFTGTTIADNQTVKAVAQALETAVETKATKGTLTNTKWCSSDGSVVNCTEDAPAGSGDITGVLDDADGAVPILAQAATAFSDADATPSVAGHSVFITANTGATTITDFDDPTSGQIILVIVNDATTTFDFTSSGLEGTSADYLASNGETLLFVYSAVDSQWHYLGFPKTLAGLTISGFTASRAVYGDASGNLVSHATLTDTELGYLDGVTSALQTQLDGKGAITGQAWTGVHDFGGATIEIQNSADPDITITGQVAMDTDAANVTNDVSIRGFDGTNQFLVSRKLKCIHSTAIKPQDWADAARDKFVIWENLTGMTFTVVSWRGTSGTDNTTLDIMEMDADGQNPVIVDAVDITTDGTGLYYAADTTITAATVEAAHMLYLNFDDTDDPAWVKMSICGWFDANVD